MRHSAEAPLRRQKLLRLNKRRNRAIQRVGHGAEQFGFGFRYHAIGADVWTQASIRFFLMVGAASASRSSAASIWSTPHCSRGNAQSPSSGARRYGAPVSNAFLISAGITAADIGQRGQHDGAIRHQRLERVILDDGGRAPLNCDVRWRSTIFCSTNSNSSILPSLSISHWSVCENCLNCSARQLPQRAQGKIDYRQTRVLGSGRNIGIQRDGFLMKRRVTRLAISASCVVASLSSSG